MSVETQKETLGFQTEVKQLLAVFQQGNLPSRIDLERL